MHSNIIIRPVVIYNCTRSTTHWKHDQKIGGEGGLVKFMVNLNDLILEKIWKRFINEFSHFILSHANLAALK